MRQSILCLVFAFNVGIARTETVLVRNGVPQAGIVIGAAPTRMQRLAAEELRRALLKMSGAELPLASDPDSAWPVSIYVGRSVHTDALGLDPADLEHGAYRMRSGDNFLVLLGRDTNYAQDKPGQAGPEFPASRADRARSAEAWAALHGERWGSPFLSYFKGYHAGLGVWSVDEHGSFNAVCDFLRMLGAEWYMPGEFGEVLPNRATVALPEVDRTVRPEFGTRNMGFYANAPFMASAEEFLWHLRLGLNACGDIGGHGIMYMLAPERVKRENPEFFALYGGRRETQSRGGKPCCSSEGLLASGLDFARTMYDRYGWSTVSLMPTDGYSALCECPLCQGSGTPERGPQGSLSDLVWSMIHRAGQEVGRTHPDRFVSCYAYGAYLLPPETIPSLSENVVIGICQNRSFFHEAETRARYRAIREGWLEKLPSRKFSIWEYYLHARPDGNLRGLPVFYPRLIAEDLRSLKGIVQGEGIEVSRDFSSASNPAPDPALAVNHLNCWVTARLWWDPGQDLDGLLAQYYRDFYGPAAAAMQAFIEHGERHWPEMSLEAGPVIRALELLDRAESSVGAEDSLPARRVRWVSDYTRRPLERIRRRLTVRRADVPYTRLGDFWGANDLRIDGDLGDGFWKHTSYCAFTLQDSRTGRSPARPTRVQAVWAFGSLHFAIHCTEDDFAGLNSPATANDDPALLEGDYVTLLLETPDHAFYEIAVAPNGVWFDIDRAGEGRPEWSSRAEVATRTGEGFWTAELRLPVLDEAQAAADPDGDGIAGRKLTPNYPWYFNCARQRRRGEATELAVRYPIGEADLRSPFHFGKLHIRVRPR